MQPYSESEHPVEHLEERFVAFSERIILGCERCGEKLVLLGLEDDWRAAEQTAFECECGEELSFANRTDEEAMLVRRLLQGSVKASGY